METSEQVRDLARRALAGSGMELLDAQVAGSVRNRVVQLTVDKAGGVTVDDCATASALISTAFDTVDPIPGPYRLDVSSPGAERVLYSVADFERAVGSLVQVKRREADPFIGTLHAVAAGTIVVEADGDCVEVDIDDIARARTVLDWGRTAKPERKRKKKKAKSTRTRGSHRER